MTTTVVLRDSDGTERVLGTLENFSESREIAEVLGPGGEIVELRVIPGSHKWEGSGLVFPNEPAQP